MIDSRYSGIVSNFNEYTYHILGCGAIGSSTATQLVRMGANKLHLYDFDKVSIENVGVSMYDTGSVRLEKTKALSIILKQINPEIEVQIHNEKFKHYYPELKRNVVVLGFDNMEYRLQAVKEVCKFKNCDFLIDGRMGAEQFQMYTFINPTVKKYEKCWYSDDKGDPEPCNAKATSYCSNMAGSFICNSIRKLITKQPYNPTVFFSYPDNTIETPKGLSFP
tara:strand:- start:22903 stop:23565 length:663 start_codon:yes stop_codon:yes gene_type:complete